MSMISKGATPFHPSESVALVASWPQRKNKQESWTSELGIGRKARANKTWHFTFLAVDSVIFIILFGATPLPKWPGRSKTDVVEQLLPVKMHDGSWLATPLLIPGVRDFLQPKVADKLKPKVV